MSRLFCRNSALLALLLAAAVSAAAGDDDAAAREPIVIMADRMQAARLGDRVEFSGNVTLKKEGMTITSDAATVLYDQDGKAIREIDARGNVIVRKDGRVAHANQANYYSSEEKIVLTGEARIVEDQNELGGERITLFVRDDRSIIEGGTVRFYQEGQGSGAAARKPAQAPGGGR